VELDPESNPRSNFLGGSISKATNSGSVRNKIHARPLIKSKKGAVGCPQNKQNKISVRTETNRNSTCFGCFLVCFAKPIHYFFGLFRFVSVFLIHIETTETNRSVSKQTEINKINWGKRNKIKILACKRKCILNCADTKAGNN
jgi:hypothetical protein